MLSVEVAFLSSDPKRQGVVIFLKTEDDERLLPIQIGFAEASAIHMKLEGLETSRPMTHDLMMNLVETLGGRVESVAVEAIRDGTFYGIIYIERGGETIEVDSRPSDAIPLALRADAPIYVHDDVMDEAGILQSDIQAVQEEQEPNEDFIRV